MLSPFPGFAKISLHVGCCARPQPSNWATSSVSATSVWLSWLERWSHIWYQIDSIKNQGHPKVESSSLSTDSVFCYSASIQWRSTFFFLWCYSQGSEGPLLRWQQPYLTATGQALCHNVSCKDRETFHQADRCSKHCLTFQKLQLGRYSYLNAQLQQTRRCYARLLPPSSPPHDYLLELANAQLLTSRCGSVG